jgi:hypothetical protein
LHGGIACAGAGVVSHGLLSTVRWAVGSSGCVGAVAGAVIQIVTPKSAVSPARRNGIRVQCACTCRWAVGSSGCVGAVARVRRFRPEKFLCGGFADLRGAWCCSVVDGASLELLAAAADTEGGYFSNAIQRAPRRGGLPAPFLPAGAVRDLPCTYGGRRDPRGAASQARAHCAAAAAAAAAAQSSRRPSWAAVNSTLAAPGHGAGLCG